MTNSLLAIRFGIGVIFLAAQAHAVQAAELQILGVPALQTSLEVLGPQFESATSHRLNINYAGSSDLVRRFAAGEPFDVALVWPALIDRLLNEGKIAAGTRAEVARAAIAVAVKKGAPRPDISTTEAFKRMLLTANSISHSSEGASGIHLKSVFERLGIIAEVQPKLRPTPGGPYVVGPVVRGEVELAIITAPYITIEPGVEMVGPLPDELQQYVIYTAGVSTATTQSEAARAFVKHLTSPAATSVLRSHGLDPVAPR